MHRSLQPIIKQIISDNIRGITLNSTEINDITHQSTCVCDTCARAKSRKATQNRSSEDRLHTGEASTDLYGPMEEETWQGSRYLQIFIRLDSKESTVFGMKHKSDTKNNTKKYMELNPDLLRLHSDGAKELISMEMRVMLSKNDIELTYSSPYSSNQNAFAER